MTHNATESSADLSPSAARSLTGLVTSRRATWRQGLDGSAALLAATFAGAAIAAIVVRFSRHRRGAS